MNPLILIVAFALFLGFAVGGLSAAPWLPTKKEHRKKYLELIGLPDGAQVYDLGCGDGRVLYDLVEKNPNISAVGLEIAFVPYFIAQFRKWRGGKRFERLSFKFKSLFAEDLSGADLIFIFLLDKSYPKLVEKFKKSNLKPDCRIFVEAWPFPGIEPVGIVNAEGLLPAYWYEGRQFE